MEYKDIITMRQKLPLKDKIALSLTKIKQFYQLMGGNVAVAFSGGKDSTVLLHLVRSLYPDVKAVFFNTTNEDKRIIKFVKETENVEIVNPNKTFKWSLIYSGYPLISKEFSGGYEKLFEITHIYPEKIVKTSMSYVVMETHPGARSKVAKKYLFLYDKKMIDKLTTEWKEEWFSDVDAVRKVYDRLREYWYDVSRFERRELGLDDYTKIKLTNRCCNYLKKNPANLYQKRHNNGFYVGTMASDSRIRGIALMKTGCLNLKKKLSMPLAWWHEEDIWEYIEMNNLKISEAYATENRTGCIMCGYGIQFDVTRFDRVKEHMPRRYEQYRRIKNIYSDISFGEAIDIVIKKFKES